MLKPRARKGDTEKWNAKKKSGWIYDGTWWRHYRQGKPTGKKEKHRMNTNTFKSLGIGQAARFFTATPSQEYFVKRKEQEDKRKAKRKAIKEARKNKLKVQKEQNKETINTLLEKNKEPSKQKPKLVGDRKRYQEHRKGVEETFGKKKTNEEKTQENIKKSKEVIDKYKKKQDQPKVKTSKTAKPKKRLTAREKLRAKNVERFGEAHVAHLQAKHADFKKMKKREMSKADFIKKYPKSQTAKRSRR